MCMLAATPSAPTGMINRWCSAIPNRRPCIGCRRPRLPCTGATSTRALRRHPPSPPPPQPVRPVASGSLVEIETLTHHAGDAPDLLMDTGISDVFDRVTDRGPGPHLLTGPIAVEGARPGDVRQGDTPEAT